MKKRFIFFVITIALVGSFFGSVFSARVTSANIIDDFLNLFKNTEILNPQNSPQNSEAPVSLYKPILDYEQAVVKAVELASPTVVSIVISKDLPIIEQCPYSPFSDLPPEFRDFFGGGFGFDFYRPCEKGTQKQEVGGGSGFIISSEGMIVTNKHVVSDTKADYTVLTNDGKKYDAKVLARDPVQDLAIIKIEATGLAAAKLGNSDELKLGQTAIAIGNALGEFRNTVSVGVISGLARNITASGEGIGTEIIQGVVQTDAAINPGNSGGPLLNLKGEVIGINTAVVSSAQNIGFAIPINQAKRAINSVKATGSIKVPYLGVRYLIINEEIAKRQKLPVDYGALVRGTEEGPGVMPNSPAAKARLLTPERSDGGQVGILAEDIILELGGVKINEVNPLSLLIQKYNIGDTVVLKIRRGGEILTLNVILAERPDL